VVFEVAIMPQSDIQPRMEACDECVSFPHTNRVGAALMPQS
jgi:hypothetical protein